MQCHRCQHENPPQAKFCLECGHALGRPCARCGTALPATARFCLECGAPVADAPGPRPAADATGAPAPEAPAASGAGPGAPRRDGSAPEHDGLARALGQTRPASGDRRHVTVLFADCVNFTAIAERLDPETIHGIMDRCLRLLADEVRRYEGTVNQFTGDGIMALFGAPIAHEHAPERAIRAALGMQAALRHYGEELRQRHDIDFQMRIGIHTGPVVFGSVGDDADADYTALGDTTNLAARLQAAAAPGAILVSEATARLVAGRFATRAVGPLTLKGKAEPVTAFEVLRALPRQPLVAVSERGLTPLVGRATELATLVTLFERARAGHGQLALVVGDAGIGKSRLLHELRQRIAGERPIWLEGRCVSFGRAIPFLPVIDLFKEGFAIDEADGEATIIDKIHQGIAALGADAATTEPYVRALLSVAPGDPAIAAMDTGARRFATFDALKRLTLATARQHPVVALVEDLHWIDQASEEYLTFVFEALATTRILLICTYRPPYRLPFGERSFVTRLALQPLSGEETATMAAAMLDQGAVPAEIRALIAAKAEGNPFFVEEVTKSLIELGALVRRPDGPGYVLGRPVAEIVIPDTIQDVIMARIDRLGDAPKQAIQVASVIGREFAVRLLQRAADLGEHVDALVGELRSLELIYEKSGVPELAYMFKHALTHDVAYESLLVQRRKQLHLLIGRATEELYADRLSEFWETLAHHFFRGEDWPRAFAYLVKAGNKARESDANRAAVHFFEQALAIAERVAAPPGEIAAIHAGKGSAHFALSEFPAALDAFRRALALATDERHRGHLQAAIAGSLLWAHEFDAALTAAGEARAIADALDNAGLAARTALVGGFVRMCRGDLETSLVCYDEAARLAGAAGESARAAEVRGLRALIANWRGDYQHAVVETAAAITVLTETNELLALGMSYSNATITFGGIGAYARALATADAGIRLGEATGDRVWRARTWNTRGWILGELGHLEAAEEANRRSLELAMELGSLKIVSELIGNAEANLADLALARGAHADAEPHLSAVLAIVGDPRNEWMVWRYKMHFQLSAAELAIARGELGRARDYIGACLQTARRTHSRRYIVRATRLLAECHLVAGNVDEAELLLAGAVHDARALGNPPQLWHALVAYGRVLDRHGRRDDAAAAWHEALGVVEATAAELPDDLRGVFQASPTRTALGELGA